MPTSASLSVIDVGHGSASVLELNGATIVVDAGQRNDLADFLGQQGKDSIEVLILSHMDADHIGGAITLILDQALKIGKIYFNPSSIKGTKTLRDLQIALAEAERAGKQITVFSGINSSMSGEFNFGDFNLEVLSPSAADAVAGPGGKGLNGTTITDNSHSVALRVRKAEEGLALIAADLDAAGFEKLLAEGRPISAPLWIYPHHGGYLGEKDTEEFLGRLISAVKPKTVIFSIGRAGTKNPRPEVVKYLVKGSQIRVACTQLSLHCSKNTPAADSFTHLHESHARGKAKNACCAGTILINLEAPQETASPVPDGHSDFIKAHVESPLCH